MYNWYGTSLVTQMVKHLPIMQETQVQSLGQEDPLEKETATHSSTLAWKILGTEDCGRLQFSSVQLLSCVQLFATPWTEARQASLSITNSQSLPKLMSIESVMPPIISSSVVPFSSCLQSFPRSGSFPMSQLFTSVLQSIGVAASTSVLPMNTQDWSPLGWTGWISLQSKGLSRIFSNTTLQKHQFFSTQLSLWCNSYIHMWLLEKP